MNAPLNVHRLQVQIASGDALDVRRFHVTASMSGLFEARVTCVAENPDIDFEAVVGHSASFTLRWGAGLSRTFTGIARSFEQIAAEDTGLSTYELVLVPALWLATQRRNYRVFQQMSEVDIATDLLGKWGIAPVLGLSGRYRKRSYRVQYGETDYAFFCRMLEDIGASFHFDAETGAKLVLADEPQSGAAREPLPYRDHGGSELGAVGRAGAIHGAGPMGGDLEHAFAVRIGRDVKPGQVTLRDHDQRSPPGTPATASAQGGQGVEGSLESYHYDPGTFVVETDRGESAPVSDDKGKYRIDERVGATLAQRRLEAARSAAKTVTFETNAYDLGPGTVVTFVDHPRSDLSPGRRYLVTGVDLRGQANESWSCSCKAASAEVPYRPALVTPRPTAKGVESATVVGPKGEEIHTDELGRVRVQFHWDREGRMDDGSSSWVPVSQSWAGAGFGGINLPRVGQEVIVDFLGGDPDQPIITGRVFTASQKTPYSLPAHRTRSAWRSNSTGHTGGHNEIMFEDLAGKELVRVQAERDFRKLVKHDEHAVVGHDATRLVEHDEKSTIQNDRTLAVGHDFTATIGHDETRSVGNDLTAAIAHDATTTVGNNETLLVQMHRSETVGVNRSRFVGANESVQIARHQSLSIGESQSVQVGGAQSVNVGASQSVSIGGAHSLKVAKASTESVLLAKALSVGLSYQISVGAAMNTSVAGVSAEEVGLTKHVVVGRQIEIICGKSKITLDATGKVTIKGTELVLDSEGPLSLKGKEIKVNGTHVVVKAEEKAHIEGPNVRVFGDPIEMNPDAN